MARLPLIPNRGMIGGLSMLLFGMVLVSGVMLWSFAARTWPEAWQTALVATVAVLSALFLGLAVYGLRAVPRE